MGVRLIKGVRTKNIAMLGNCYFIFINKFFCDIQK
jgi:hypothetical protein